MKYNFEIREVIKDSLTKALSDYSPSEAITHLALTSLAIGKRLSEFNTGAPEVDKYHGVVDSALTKISLALIELEQVILLEANNKPNDFLSCDELISIANIEDHEALSDLNSRWIKLDIQEDKYNPSAPAPERMG